MALPDTTNQTPLFVTRRPAWEDGVELEQSAQSDVVTSRNGLEQRQQRSGRNMWKISFKAYLSASEREARRRRSLAEIRTMLWVPFWTEHSLTAAMSTNALTLDRETSLDFFAPGDWVFFDSPTQGQQFRQIEAQGGTAQQVTLAAGSGSITFDVGTPVYPCRACVREGGLAEFEDEGEATSRETLTYATL